MVGRPPVVHRKQPDPLRPISKIETPECLILNKQQELANIIEDLLSQDLSGRWCPSPGSSRSVEISLNDLNARLLGWHNSLPSYLRWDIWGSGFGDIEQNIAELQYVRLYLFLETFTNSDQHALPHRQAFVESAILGTRARTHPVQDVSRSAQNM